jgi:molybdate transport system substrate-binding protein
MLATGSAFAAVSGEPLVVRVAVAANFAPTAGRLCDAYFAARPGRCVLTPGASGVLAAQAAQGAPFDVLLSADRRRAERLVDDGVAVRGSRFTYAIGRLVAWAPGWHGAPDLGALLASGAVRTIAIANPDSAPYGTAALETLRAFATAPGDRWRIVQGTNVAQAFQFVASGAVDVGFVAWSQVLEYRTAARRDVTQQVVPVSAALHAPIEQQAVLLAGANAGARDWLEFLRTPAGRRIIEHDGYALPPR